MAKTLTTTATKIKQHTCVYCKCTIKLIVVEFFNIDSFKLTYFSILYIFVFDFRFAI